MALTLLEMKEGMADKVVQSVVDTFVRKSEILELMQFDDAVSPNGGSTLTYGYNQVKTPSQAAFRAINQEYVASEAKTVKKTVDLKVFGGSFQMDRVLNSASGNLNNLQFQVEQKIKAAIGTFHNAMINGDSTKKNLEFDGLDKMLVGTKSEFNKEAVIDLSNMENLKKNASQFYENLVSLINKTGANAILVNEQMKTKIQTVARELGYKTESEEAFGRVVTTIGENKVRIIDLGNVVSESGDETPIIKVGARTVGGSQTGITDIYAVKFDVNEGFHGVSLTGNNSITAALPDFTTPGAVKTGDVEMVAAVALKNTKAAGILRNIKVQ